MMASRSENTLAALQFQLFRTISRTIFRQRSPNFGGESAHFAKDFHNPVDLSKSNVFFANSLRVARGKETFLCTFQRDGESV